MSTFTDIRDSLVKIGLPLIGAALPFPGGAALGEALAAHIGSSSSKPEDILATLISSADAVQKAKEFEATNQTTILNIRISAEVAQMQAVNATLQADARGDSWLQKNHHAIESLTATTTITAIYVLLPILKIPVPAVPEFAFMMLGAILGVTAWQHGEVNKTIAGNQ